MENLNKKEHINKEINDKKTIKNKILINKLRNEKNYYNKLDEEELNSKYLFLIDELKKQVKMKDNLNNEYFIFNDIYKQLPKNKKEIKNFEFKFDESNITKKLKKEIFELKKKNEILKGKIESSEKFLNNKVKKLGENLTKDIKNKNKKILVNTVTDQNSLKKDLNKQEYLNLIDQVKKRLNITIEYIKKLHIYLNKKSWIIDYNINFIKDIDSKKIQNTKNTLKDKLIELTSKVESSENKFKNVYNKRCNLDDIINNLNKELIEIKEENIKKEKKLREFDIYNPIILEKEIEHLQHNEKVYKERLEELMKNKFIEENKDNTNIINLLKDHEEKKLKKENDLIDLDKKLEESKSSMIKYKTDIKKYKEEITDFDEELVYLKNKKENHIIEFRKENNYLFDGNEENYFKILKIVNKNNYLKKAQKKLISEDKLDNKEEFYNKIIGEKNEFIKKLEEKRSILNKNIEEEKSLEENFNLKKLEYLKKIENCKNKIISFDNILINIKSKDKKEVAHVYNKIKDEKYFYDNNISIFSDSTNDYRNLNSNDDNILDIHFGKFDIKNSDLENKKIIINITFNNYEIATSNLINPKNENFNFLSSFIINTNSKNLLNLYNEKLIVEVFTKDINDKLEIFGFHYIKLKYLIKENLNNNSKKLSSVCNFKLILKEQKKKKKKLEKSKKLGIINYTIRFRIPITDNLNLIKQKKELKIKQSIIEKRKIIINIEKGYDFPNTSKSFFDFDFYNNKETSKPILGSKPKFKFKKKYSISIDKEFKNYVRNEKFEILFFDDSIPIDKIKNDEDFIGSCIIDLIDLLYEKSIFGKHIIIKNKKKVCSVLISIHFKEYPIKIDKKKFKYDTNWENKSKNYIIDLMKQKKLTIQKLFFYNKNLSKNVNGIVYKNEFFISIKNLTLKYFKDKEINMIFDLIKKKNILSNNSNKNQTNLDEIQDYFGNLLTYSLVKNESSQSSISIEENINKNKNRNDKDNFLINKFKTIFEEYMKKYKLNTRNLLIKLNTNNKGFLIIDDFENFFKKNKINVKKSEINTLFNLMDQDKDLNIDIKEFLNFFHLKSKELIRRKSSLINSLRSINENIVSLFINDFQDYMKKNNLNIINIYNILDENRNQELTKNDFKDKILYKFKFKYNDNELEYLFNQIDDDNSGTIQIEEFLNLFDKKDILKKVKDFDYINSLENNKIIKKIYKYIIKNDLTVADFILKVIDNDNNGKINLLNLNRFFRKLKFYNNDDQLEEFFKLVNPEGNLEFDKNELNRVIYAYETKIVKKETVISNSLKYDLLCKIQKILNSKEKILKNEFENKEKDYKNIIFKSEFKLILETNTNLKKNEIDLILNPLLLPYWKMDKINYQQFLNIIKLNKKFIDTFKPNKENKIFEIFKTIKDIAKSKRISEYGLYSLFIDNKEKKFNIKSFLEVLDKMEINYNIYDVKEFFNELDTERDGEITFNEFLKYLSKFD